MTTTTLADAEQAIYARFLANFTGTSNIVFTNEETPFDLETVTEWVRLSVQGLGRLQDTLGKIGNRRFRESGTVFVQVYTVVDSGVKQNTTLAQEARNIFEGVSFSGLDFQGGVDIRKSGVDGKWFQGLVEAQFDFDEIK